MRRKKSLAAPSVLAFMHSDLNMFLFPEKNRMYRCVQVLIAFFASTFWSGATLAEPTTGPVKILEVRPYNVPGASASAYVRIDQVALCNTDTYRIDLTWNGSKEVLATALSALVADKPVKVEVANSGCTGWATPIQSLYILKQ